MIDSEQHPDIEWIAREARRPVVTDPAARARIMAAVRAEAAPVRRPRLWSIVDTLVERRALLLSPAAGTLLAAGLVGIGVALGSLARNNRDVRSSVGQLPVAVAAPQLPVSDTVVKFVYVAPGAAKVSVVGDFNGWDSTRTPMTRSAKSGMWTATLPLTSGRHLYAFVVDGTAWYADPSGLLAPDDGFGRPNSVTLVGRRTAL
jgi:hypothetical protein